MDTRRLVRRALLAATLCTGLAALPQAQAAFIVNGYANGSEAFDVISPVASGNFSAGGFTGTWNGTTINFWCTELNEYISFGTPYTNYLLSALNSGDLSKLFFEAGGANDTVSSAALQLAIWEIVYDSGSGYDLANGAFKVTGGDADAITMAQGWLNGLPHVTGQAALFVLSANGNQDQIGGGPPPPRLLLPEPAPLSLLGIGVLAIVFAMRRRRGGAVFS